MSADLRAVTEILSRCGSPSAVLPPTQLYNEGWMLRLLLDWLQRNPDFKHVISPREGARWYSEALLASPFLPRWRGDPRAESFTHADGVVGHFDVDSERRGDARLLPDASQFVVIEAKLGSGLSPGTKNAPTFDQAARNVACIAHLATAVEKNGKPVETLGFFVTAPRSQIQQGVFASLVTRESIGQKVQERVAAYDGELDAWFVDVFKPMLSRIQIEALAWEDILESLPSTSETASMASFYERCLQHNPMRNERKV